MSYEKTLTQISKNILTLDENLAGLDLILQSSSLQNFKIYRSNYEQLVFKSLSDSFPATKKYIGDNNFYFFAYKMLKEKGIASPNINDISLEFNKYIREQEKIHKDHLLVYITQVDLLWSMSLDEEVQVPFGLLEYWQELMTGVEVKKIINLDHLVTLKVFDDDGEQAFKVLR